MCDEKNPLVLCLALKLSDERLEGICTTLVDLGNIFACPRRETERGPGSVDGRDVGLEARSRSRSGMETGLWSDRRVPF